MGIYRWCSAALLVLAFSASANAATITVPVAKTSVQDLLNAANPVLNENPLGYVQAYDSPFQYQQRPYSVPVKQKVTIPTPAIKDALKGALKQQAGVAVASAAISAAVAAAGWVIDTAGQPVKKVEGEPVSGDEPGNFYWTARNQDGQFMTPAAACEAFRERATMYTASKVVFESTSSGYCLGKFADTDYQYRFTELSRWGTSCPKNSTYSPDQGVCLGTSNAPVTDADYDNLTTYIDGQSAEFRARLARDSCEGSLSPGRCYQALQDAASFLNSGPSSIQGPTSSSTTTHKNADGTSSISTTTSDTKFKAEYNSDGATLKPEKTTITRNPDGSTSETVEKEEDNSTTVQKPGEPEEEEDNPLDKDYTFTNPDMPEVPSFYEQKYPDGLKSVWDDNESRFDNSAFISFMKSFVPSFSGSCPTWGLPMNIMAQASYGYVTFANICYVFDFVKIVIIATSVFTARKIMFGG